MPLLLTLIFKLDPRVVTVLTPELCKISNPPKYAIHFTKTPIALSIWNKETTKAKIPTKRELPEGCICKFERAIHALTCVEKNGERFQIFETHSGIRDRMVHGINDDISRPKYQAGLVIDLERLCNVLPEGMVQINELTTLLVHQDIPHECLIACLHRDDDLNYFWRISEN